MKKIVFLAMITLLGKFSYGQSFAGAPLGLLINNTSNCEVYVSLQGTVTTIGGSVCGDAITTTFHLMPAPGPGNTYYTPSWDATNMFYSGSGSFGPTDVVSFKIANFQFANCACGSAGGDMGIVGCGALLGTWINGCINGAFTVPPAPGFSSPLLVRF